MDVWLWDLVVISNLLHWVCKSEVLVLLSWKFDWNKVGLANKMLKLELLLAPLESFAIHLVAGRKEIAQIETPINCRSIYKFCFWVWSSWKVFRQLSVYSNSKTICLGRNQQNLLCFTKNFWIQHPLCIFSTFQLIVSLRGHISTSNQNGWN